MAENIRPMTREELVAESEQLRKQTASYKIAATENAKLVLNYIEQARAAIEILEMIKGAPCNSDRHLCSCQKRMREMSGEAIAALKGEGE